ncbi:hypothetical protein D3C72_2181720 [compost metagenome]
MQRAGGRPEQRLRSQAQGGLCGAVEVLVAPAEFEEVAVVERLGQSGEDVEQVGAGDQQPGMQAVIHHLDAPPLALGRRRGRRAGAAEQRQAEDQRCDAHRRWPVGRLMGKAL